MPSINLFHRAARITDPSGESETLRDLFAVIAVLLSHDDLLFESDEDILRKARAAKLAQT